MKIPQSGKKEFYYIHFQDHADPFSIYYFFLTISSFLSGFLLKK